MVSRTSRILLISLLVGGSLLQAIPNCKTPNAAGDSCDVCNDGFAKTPKAADATKKECTKCGDKCKKCADGTAATTPGDCSECEIAEGFGIDQTDKKKCSACTDTNCKVCKADPTKCTECKTDFTVKSDKCISCKAPCKECSDADKCSSCITGAYFLESQQCKACATGCAQCSATNTCTKCQEGFFLNAQNVCTNNCGTGLVGNALTGKCETCPSNCVSCTKVGQCDSCNNGYYLSSTAQCTACGANCSSCYSNGRCKTCTGETVLQDDGTCEEEHWYNKWWWWLLIGLGVLGLLGALAWLLSRKTPQQNYGGYQQWDDNTSYAPRVQQPSYQAQPQNQSSFRESATYQRPLSPARQSQVVVGQPVRVTYSPGRPVVQGPPVVHRGPIVGGPGYELQQRSRYF